jgi:hypothetical protein
MEHQNLYKQLSSKRLLALLTACLLTGGNVFAADMSSTNYSIKWDVMDGGGGDSASTNYIVEASSGQSTAVGTSSSANYAAVAGFETISDSDADRILDTMDNCTQVENLNQRDTDGDGYGNICDPDLDNNLITNAADLAIFKPLFFTADPDADFDGSGVVNAADLAILKAMFFKPPGPSGIVP